MAAEVLRTTCCIAGGGPAGMMLGLLLARAGVEVVVLEKHADFLRDFRGDTIHPSTLEVMHELGLIDELLRRPHQKVHELTAQVGPLSLPIADFRRLGVRFPFIAFMPQWDFLDLLAQAASRYPGFTLRMESEAKDLVWEEGRVAGVIAAGPDGPLQLHADLVVAADGRHSTLRAAAGLEVRELGAPMDVLWFRLARRPGDPELTMGRFQSGGIFVMINRGDYWQCGFVIAKGSAERIRAQGLDEFRRRVSILSGLPAGRLAELQDWEQVKLLTVSVDRLRRWHRPGLICIGDAAHAMSPIGGVGINLAIQDGVAAANLLAAPLRERRVSEADLARLQRRREWPTRVTQALQLAMQNRVIAPLLDGAGALEPPMLLRLLARFPLLQKIPARVVGIGVRPEHVESSPAQVREGSPGQRPAA